jgi:hypothetical protein
MNEKGVTPMDMRLLLTLLEAIKHVCTYKKGTLESSERSSNKGEKGKKCPGTISTARVPKKVHFEKHCNLCKKHGGAYTMHNTCDCHRFEKDGKEKSDFCTTKKGRKKGNPVNQNFVQLTKKIEKLEKALQKSGKKGQKRCYEDSDSNSKYGVGTSEVQNKMIFMGHQMSSCHVPVVRSFFILWKMLLLSQNLPYDHLQICANITFQYPKK